VLWSKAWRDFLRQDGGAYLEIIGPGSPLRPITGRVTGLAHLDSLRCYPTGDPEFPVIYYNRMGSKHKLHFTRVLHLVDMPDGDEFRFGYGECALSRAIAIAEQQYYMLRYIRSEMDELPPPGFASLQNMTTDTFLKAVSEFQERKQRDLPPVYGNLVLLPGMVKDTAPKVDITTYSHAPEKFDYVLWVNCQVNGMALALGIDKQEIWELGGSGLGSGKQSEVLHMKSQGRMYGHMLSIATRNLNDVLPDSCEQQFEKTDSYESQEAADTAGKWAGFVSSVSDSLSVDEKRRLIASVVPQYKDVVTNAAGEIVRLPDDDPKPTDEDADVTLDDATANGGAGTGAVSAKAKEIASGFVYIDLANEPYLVDLQKQLKLILPPDAKIDWQIPSTFHITLAYCPSVTNAQFIRAAAAVAADPFMLKGSDLGIFENGDERALYLAIDRMPSLVDLQHDIAFGFEAASAELSPFSQPDAYTPHITLCYLPPDVELPPIKANFTGLCRTVVFGRDQYQPFVSLNLAENNSRTLENSTLLASKAFDDTRAAFVSDLTDTITSARANALTRRRAGTVMRAVIQRHGKASYEAGLTENGVLDGMDSDDRLEFTKLIAEQSGFVTEFLDSLYKDGLTNPQIHQHASMWATKTLQSFYQAGLLSADKNGMYTWKLGSGEHCATCLRLANQTHRMKSWSRRKLTPGSSALDCKGFNCKCYFQKTKARASGKF